MYWDNIDPRIIEAQAKIFSYFGYPIEQVEKTGLDHGDWMDSVMEDLAEEETILFVDIDCIPTKKSAIEKAIDAARQGKFYGVAQVANHKDKTHIYISPVYMCLSKASWRAMGSPSFKETDISDAGQNVTRVAEKLGFPLEMSMTTGCLKPMWNLADVGLYGIGTFYQSGLFHLFQARKQRNIKWFLRVVEQVLSGETLNPMALQKRYRRGFGLF
jgi:hypothetical protein